MTLPDWADAASVASSEPRRRDFDGMSVEQWKQKTFSLVKEAGVAMDEADCLVADVMKQIRKHDAQTKAAELAVTESLETSIQSITRLKGTLESQLSRTIADMDIVEGRCTELGIRVKEADKHVQRARMSLGRRTNRPGREQVRDTVEEGLESEFEALVDTKQTFDYSRQTLIAEYNRLYGIRAAITADRDCKKDALNVDVEMLNHRRNLLQKFAVRKRVA